MDALLRKLEAESVADPVTALARMQPELRSWLRALAAQGAPTLVMRRHLAANLTGRAVVSFAVLLCEPSEPPRLLPPYGALQRLLPPYGALLRQVRDAAGRARRYAPERRPPRLRAAAARQPPVHRRAQRHRSVSEEGARFRRSDESGALVYSGAPGASAAPVTCLGRRSARLSLSRHPGLHDRQSEPFIHLWFHARSHARPLARERCCT